jgi:hypothetical protein
MGIEPTTFSLGSWGVSNPINRIAAKPGHFGLCCIKGLEAARKTAQGHWTPKNEAR